MRHAKATQDYFGIEDADRPLTSKGILASQLVSSKSLQTNLFPEYVFSSLANRALHTAVIYMKIAKIPFSNLQIVPELYFTGLKAHLAFVSGLDDKLSSIMLVGHNPDLTHLLQHLSKEKKEEIKTSELIFLEHPASTWKESLKKLRWNINSVIDKY